MLSVKMLSESTPEGHARSLVKQLQNGLPGGIKLINAVKIRAFDGRSKRDHRCRFRLVSVATHTPLD